MDDAFGVNASKSKVMVIKREGIITVKIIGGTLGVVSKFVYLHLCMVINTNDGCR